jgi:hypothetical protein
MLRFLAIAMLGLVLACPAYAQNCSLCYTQASKASAKFIQGLRSGILLLVIPPMFMSVGITVLAYRKRNKFKRADDHGDALEW